MKNSDQTINYQIVLPRKVSAFLYCQPFSSDQKKIINLNLKTSVLQTLYNQEDYSNPLYC